MSDPKVDCDILLNSVLPVAEQILSSYGEFSPFGGAMRPDGKLVSISCDDGNEYPRSVDIIALMKEVFVEAAGNGEFKATAIVHDVRIKSPSSDEKTDAVAVALDHQCHYSVVVFFPYKIDAGTLTMGDAVARTGEADIFPTQ